MVQRNSQFPPALSEWQSTHVVQLFPHVWRLTAPNPGFMTGPGTNTYLIGDAQSGFTVVDPGPDEAAHIGRLWQFAPNIQQIVCTHSHPDHAPGAAPLQALCPHKPPILGLPSAPTARPGSVFVPDRVLQNRELLTHIPCALEAIFTPGHAANHVCLLLPSEGLLLTGDHILNGSTTVIDPPDGNMRDYLHSLDVLLAACQTHSVQWILPAHGHVLGGSVDAVVQAIARLKAHRLAREAKIAAVVGAKPQGTVDEWLTQAYDDVPPSVWPVARRSLLAHLEHLLVPQ